MSKPRLRFGLDLDGCVYDWHSAACFLLSQWAGRTVKQEEVFDRWRSTFDEVVGKGADEFLWSEGVKQGLFRHGHVRKGAISFVQELDALADIVVVTHRPKQARQDTLDWLAFHRIPVKEIHLLENMEPKWKIELDCLLDDKYQNIIEFVDNTPIYKTGLIWNRPWNQDDGVLVEPPVASHILLRRGVKIRRMSSWQEVLNWVRVHPTS